MGRLVYVHCYTLIATGVHVAHRADTQLALTALRVVGDGDSRVLVDCDAIFTPDDVLRRCGVAGSAPQRGGEAHEDSGGGGRVSEDQLAKTAWVIEISTVTMCDYCLTSPSPFARSRVFSAFLLTLTRERRKY